MIDWSSSPSKPACTHAKVENRYHPGRQEWMDACRACGTWVALIVEALEEEEVEEEGETCPIGQAPGVRPDMKPHYSLAEARHFGSRRDFREYQKRNGLREVDPSEVGDAGDIQNRAVERSRATSRAVRNPKVSLQAHLHEMFHGRIDVR